MQQYKPELDGLRAVAVVCVLLFHGGFEALEGGFVGVDIFFVLSGYLITSILLKEIRSGEFSYSGFYERRIRRLVPPVIPVLLFTGFASGVLLASQQFESMIKSTLSALGMVSNWFFLSSVDYFDGPGETTPLLHTWSLSIEEQFYLLFPVMLVVALRRFPRYVVACCVTLLLTSLLLSVWLVNSGHIDNAFYASPARFWELLVGSLLATLGWGKVCSRAKANLREVAGAALIGLAVFTYSPATLFPGLSALLPTLGAAMIITAAGKGTLVSPILKLKPVVWVGLISYALYLWHWPFLVFLRIIEPNASWALICAVLMLSVLCAALSRWFIELPVRSRRILKGRRTVFAFGVVFAVSVLAVTLSLMTPLAEKKRSRLASLVASTIYGERAAALEVIEREAVYYKSQLNLNFNGENSFSDLEPHQFTCSYDKNNSSSRLLECFERQAQGDVVLVMGDSIGRDTWHALRRAYPENRFVMLHQSSCPPGDAIHVENLKLRCFPNLAEILDSISERLNVKAVILSYRYRPVDWKHIEPTLRLLRQMTDNVALFGVSPVYDQEISESIKKLPPQAPVPRRVGKTDQTMVPWDYDLLAANAKKMADTYGAVFIDVRPFFCDAKSCSLWLDNSLKLPLFWDEQHLSDPAITKFGKYLSRLQELQEFFMQAKLSSAR